MAEDLENIGEDDIDSPSLSLICKWPRIWGSKNFGAKSVKT